MEFLKELDLRWERSLATTSSWLANSAPSGTGAHSGSLRSFREDAPSRQEPGEEMRQAPIPHS